MFSTAHKAKGLEFDTVRLGEDFLQDCPINELSKLCTLVLIKLAICGTPFC